MIIRPREMLAKADRSRRTSASLKNTISIPCSTLDGAVCVDGIEAPGVIGATGTAPLRRPSNVVRMTHRNFPGRDAGRAALRASAREIESTFKIIQDTEKQTTPSKLPGGRSQINHLLRRVRYQRSSPWLCAVCTSSLRPVFEISHGISRKSFARKKDRMTSCRPHPDRVAGA